MKVTDNIVVSNTFKDQNKVILAIFRIYFPFIHQKQNILIK